MECDSSLGVSEGTCVTPSSWHGWHLPSLGFAAHCGDGWRLAQPRGSLVAVSAFDDDSDFLSSLTKTPTLILYGDHDTSLGAQALQSLRHLPRHRVAVLPDAGHACYMDKPEDFHRALLGFLRQLK